MCHLSKTKQFVFKFLLEMRKTQILSGQHQTVQTPSRSSKALHELNSPFDIDLYFGGCYCPVVDEGCHECRRWLLLLVYLGGYEDHHHREGICVGSLRTRRDG
eukprot:PhF_6_TR31399/c0_g2_i2/m.46000